MSFYNSAVMCTSLFAQFFTSCFFNANLEHFPFQIYPLRSAFSQSKHLFSYVMNFPAVGQYTVFLSYQDTYKLRGKSHCKQRKYNFITLSKVPSFGQRKENWKKNNIFPTIKKSKAIFWIWFSCLQSMSACRFFFSENKVNWLKKKHPRRTVVTTHHSDRKHCSSLSNMPCALR